VSAPSAVVQLRREIAHQPVHVGCRVEAEIDDSAPGCLLITTRAIQIRHRNVDAADDKEKRQGFARNLRS